VHGLRIDPLDAGRRLQRGLVNTRPFRAGLLLSGLGLGACLGLSEVDDPTGVDAGSGGQVNSGGGFPGGGSGGDASLSGGAAGSAGAGSSGGSGGSTGGSGGSAGGTLTVHPGLALMGDGFLASPDLCGDPVIDSYGQPSYKAIHAGRDQPCGNVATYRAFMRFELTALEGLATKTAKLRFYYASKASPTAAVHAVYVADFGQLDANDWNVAERQNLGDVLDPSTIPGWVELDVTSPLADALSKGDAALAFELRYDDEAQDPAGKSRWYGVVAVENGGGLEPSLVVTY
jgi:hypothetical protein